MIEPIGKPQQDEVIQLCLAYLDHAETLYGMVFPAPDIQFDLSGQSAGMFRARPGHYDIRFNPWIFAKYFDESLANTVPHEVAHYVVHMLYGSARTRPHGAEWQDVMRNFDAEPRVTGDYNLEGIPVRRQRRFRYQCRCREHQVSTLRHNRVIRGQARYRCRYCNTDLRYIGEPQEA